MQAAVSSSWDSLFDGAIEHLVSFMVSHRDCQSSHSCISFRSFSVPTGGDKSSNMQSQAVNVKIKQKLLD